MSNISFPMCKLKKGNKWLKVLSINQRIVKDFHRLLKTNKTHIKLKDLKLCHLLSTIKNCLV